VAKSKTPAEMRQKVLKQYPGLGMPFTLDSRIGTYFPPAGAPAGAPAAPAAAPPPTQVK